MVFGTLEIFVAKVLYAKILVVRPMATKLQEATNKDLKFFSDVLDLAIF